MILLFILVMFLLLLELCGTPALVLRYMVLIYLVEVHAVVRALLGILKPSVTHAAQRLLILGVHGDRDVILHEEALHHLDVLTVDVVLDAIALILVHPVGEDMIKLLREHTDEHLCHVVGEGIGWVGAVGGAVQPRLAGHFYTQVVGALHAWRGLYAGQRTELLRGGPLLGVAVDEYLSTLGLAAVKDIIPRTLRIAQP